MKMANISFVVFLLKIGLLIMHWLKGGHAAESSAETLNGKHILVLPQPVYFVTYKQYIHILYGIIIRFFEKVESYYDN